MVSPRTLGSFAMALLLALTALAVSSVPQARAASLDKARFLKKLKSQFGPLRKCWSDAQKKEPELGGKVVLTIDFSTEGRATDATATSPTLPQPLLNCMVRAAKRWRIGPMPNRIRIKYPLITGPGPAKRKRQ